MLSFFEFGHVLPFIGLFAMPIRPMIQNIEQMPRFLLLYSSKSSYFRLLREIRVFQELWYWLLVFCIALALLLWFGILEQTIFLKIRRVWTFLPFGTKNIFLILYLQLLRYFYLFLQKVLYHFIVVSHSQLHLLQNRHLAKMVRTIKK